MSDIIGLWHMYLCINTIKNHCLLGSGQLYN